MVHISRNVMELCPVKSLINKNMVKTLKSLVNNILFHCMHHLTASVYKQVLHMHLTINIIDFIHYGVYKIYG